MGKDREPQEVKVEWREIKVDGQLTVTLNAKTLGAVIDDAAKAHNGRPGDHLQGELPSKPDYLFNTSLVSFLRKR